MNEFFHLSVSWDSTDEEINQFQQFHSENHQSTVASRTRSHTPPHEHHDKKQVWHLVLLSLFLILFFFRKHLQMANDPIRI